MEVKDDLIPEMELSIIPAKDGTLQVELMHKDFIKFLKEKGANDIIFMTSRELKSFIDKLQEVYKEYCKR
jgi:hypothetical protein